jgi:hypothetical protein
MVKSCTVFSKIKHADGFVLISRNNEPGRAGSPSLYLWCVTLVWMDKPLDRCGRPPCVPGVFGRAQTAGHRLIIAMWEFVTCQDGVAFIVGPRVHPICNTE